MVGELVTVEILGHMWVPDIDSNGVHGTGMHHRVYAQDGRR